MRTGGPQVTPGHPGLPCADGFNGVLRALPGERCTIAPVAFRIADARARSGRHITARLDAQTLGVINGWRALTVEAERGRCQRRVVSRKVAAHGIPALQPPCAPTPS